MKKEKFEELYVKGADGLLDVEGESLFATLLEESPELEAEVHQSRELSKALHEAIPGSVEPQYGDFFNSQLMRKVDLQIASQKPARRAERWWQSLRWAWAPAGALALVLSFFAGHRLAKPSIGDGLVGNAALEQPIRMASLPSVYFTSDSLDANVISNSDGDVSVIVVNGLDALKDDFNLPTVSRDSDRVELPVSYLRSEAREFH